VIRAFLALELSEEILVRYAALHGRESARRRGLRWVHPGNIHVTLRFLGDTAENRIETLRREVDGVTLGIAPFRVSIGNPGCFGPQASPQVLWFGIDEGASRLAFLAEGIEDAVRRLDLPPEDRPWRAHLTVARNPGRVRFDDWETVLREAGICGLCFEAREVTLLSSKLGPQGPSYTMVFKSTLKGYSSPH